MIHTQAYYKKMFAPKYVWIIPVWYNDTFWHTSNNNSSCTDEIMIQVVNGTIGVIPDGYSTLQNDTVQIFSGIVS